jgi:hypothetical protein
VKSSEIDDGEGVECRKRVNESLELIENEGCRFVGRAQEFGRC